MKKQKQIKISAGLARSISSVLLEYQKILEKDNRHYGIRGYRELLEQAIYEAEKKNTKSPDFRLSL